MLTIFIEKVIPRHFELKSHFPSAFSRSSGCCSLVDTINPSKRGAIQERYFIQSGLKKFHMILWTVAELFSLKGGMHNFSPYWFNSIPSSL